MKSLQVHSTQKYKYNGVHESEIGAEYTSSLETFIKSTNRAVQAATSHHLGTNTLHILRILMMV
jgi:prolyl-tRNA synthetase